MLNGSAAVDHKDSVPNGGRNVLLRPPRNGSRQRHHLVPLTFYHEFSFGHYHRLINDPYLWLGTGRNEERAGATNFGQLEVFQGQFRDLDLNIGKVDRRDLAVTATRDKILRSPDRSIACNSTATAKLRIHRRRKTHQVDYGCSIARAMDRDSTALIGGNGGLMHCSGDFNPPHNPARCRIRNAENADARIRGSDRFILGQ